MKSYYKIFVFCIIIFLCISSCQVYAPNTLNVSGFNRKGEVHASAHISNGLNIQTAYAITDKIGIMGNLLSNNSTIGTASNSTESRKGKANFGELGIGYFTTNESKSRFEMYGGIGLGKIGIGRSTNNATPRRFEANGTRFFIQPSIGRRGKSFEIYLSTRASILKYNNVVTTYSVADLSGDKFIDIDKPTWIFLEPAVTMRFGFKSVKFQLQLGRSFKLNSEDLGYEQSIFGVGGVFQL